MDLQLEGKLALVSGSTAGIGYAIAEALAAEGAHVIVTGRTDKRVRDAVAKIKASGARGQLEGIAADLGSAAGVRTTVERFPEIDILVNNVGIGGGGDGPAHRANEEAFDRILTVNLKSAWMTIKHALPVMREQGFGSIVNISSLASIAGGTQVAYEVSKAAVNRLTTSVANANAAHGVRCNAVLPGLMDTPMAVSGIAAVTGSTTAAVRKARNARVPLRGKMGTGWDTAHAALFLASDEANFITGVLLPVDGGMSARVG